MDSSIFRSKFSFHQLSLLSFALLSSAASFADCASDRKSIEHSLETGSAASVSQLLSVKKICGSELAIRSFEKMGVSGLLLVDPKTLKTHLEARSCVECRETQADEWSHTPYGQLLSSSTAAPFPADNDGIVRGKKGGEGFFLTIDLCPSHKSFEKRLFTGLYQLPVSNRDALPVAFAISGSWARKHGSELNWIRDQEASGKLNVTWVNHTNTHPYNPRIPDTKNFLLMPGTDVRSEIEVVEKELILRGLAPSVFFRFPGLISSQGLIERVRSYGLIPLGAEAWLSKGQPIRKGSIVLVHGNGNEPDGISKMLHYIHQYPDRIHLLDLSELAQE